MITKYSQIIQNSMILPNSPLSFPKYCRFRKSSRFATGLFY